MNQSKIEELLAVLVDWTKVSNYTRVRDMLVQVFGTEDEPKGQQRLVYSLLGERYTQKQIADMAQTTQPTVSTWSTQWKRLGLVRSDGTPAFNLTDFGMSVPKPKAPRADSKSGEPVKEGVDHGSED